MAERRQVEPRAGKFDTSFMADDPAVVFSASNGIAYGREFYADVRGRMVRIGRDPDHLKILP